MDAFLADLLAYKGLVVAAWLGLFFAAERLHPAASPPRDDTARPGAPTGGIHRLGRNLALFAINVGMSPLVVLPLSAWAAEHPLWTRPSWWSGWSGLALDLLILDLLIYWWHRANHELSWLWRFHEVHHLDRFLDSTTAVRFHFGEVLLSAAARAGVIVLLAIPFFTVLLFETLVLLASIFHHSNLRLPANLERRLSRLLVTPSIHWVHHHARRRDTDSNYGTILSFWDPLFATRSPMRRTPDMPIGVERGTEQPFAGLLIRPVNRSAETDGSRPAVVVDRK